MADSHPNTWHIIPVNDLKPHTEEGYECECNPQVKYNPDDEFVLVVHNAYDNRERIEILDLGKLHNN